MKTLPELYNEVIASDELKKEFLEAGKNGKAEEFLKTHGCEATPDEIKAFFEKKANADKELSAEELENVAGGTCNGETELETILSVVSAGTLCAFEAILSAKEGHVGQKTDAEGRLCTGK